MGLQTPARFFAFFEGMAADIKCKTKRFDSCCGSEGLL